VGLIPSNGAELITNGGFETVGSGWSVSQLGSDGWWNINNASGAHGGNRYQYLGRASDGITTANNAEGLLYQDVTIPAGTVSTTLSFWMRISTLEAGSTAFDTLKIEIRNTSNTLLQTLATYSNVDASSNWVQKTLSISGYVGQTIRVTFHGKTDASVETVFRLDDVSLVTTAGSGTVRLTVNSASGGALAASEMNAVLLFQNTGGSSVARKQPPPSNPMDFSGTAYGSYYFFVFCWDQLAAQSGTFSHASSTTNVSATANQKRPLNLYVFCNDNQTPLQNATVTLWSWNGEFSQWYQRASGTTNSNGVWTVNAWPTTQPGEKYQATATYQGNQVGIESNITVPDTTSGRTQGIYTSVAPPPPTVTRVVSSTPSGLPDNLLMGGDWQQTVDVYGSGFVHGGQFAVRLDWTGDFKVLDPGQITPVDTTHFRMAINVGADVDNWAIQVRNYDGQWSNAHFFEVELAPVGFNLQTPLVNQVSSNWQVQLNWGESLYADNYDVYRDGQVVASNLSSSARQYTDTSVLTPGTSYSYRVNAKNRVSSTFSNTQSALIPNSSALDIQVTSPNGGESFAPGSTQTIQWSVTGSAANQGAVSYFWVATSADGGTTFSNYSTADRLARSINWTVPLGLSSNQMRVRVRALDSAGNILDFDVSDANFTVAATDPGKLRPVIQAPGGLETVPGGSLSFTSTGSTPSNGASITGYEWRVQGVGVVSQAGSLSLTFFQSGSFWVQLRITDSAGKSDTTAVTVNVQGLGLKLSGVDAPFSPDPVNLANGNFIMDNMDLSMPGRGLPFSFRRFYNSGSYIPPATGDPPVAPGPLGYSWRHSYEISVSPLDASNQRLVHWDDGRRDTFNLENGQYKAPLGVYDTLVENGDQTLTLTTKAQVRYLFDASGKLTAIKDRNDNTIAVTYDLADRVDFVTDTVGRVIDFQYNGDGRLIALEHDLREDTSTTPPTIVKRRIEYEYDANHDLRVIRDARGKPTLLDYDALHQIIEGRSAKGHRFVKNEYGTDDYARAVVKQWDALNHLSRFVYDFDNHVTRFYDALCETDATRQPEFHEHDEKLRLIKRTDPGGFVEEFGYDASGNRTTVEDKRGSVTTYQYDGRGNVTRKIAPLQNGVKILEDTVISYNTLNDPMERTDPSGAITKWEYDPKGNVSAVTFPFIAATPNRYRRTFTVNAYGQVTDKLNARGFNTHIDYDALGNPWKVTDALGGETESHFDLAGRVTKTIDARDNPTEYLLDASDHVLRVRRFLSGQPVDTLSTYDDNGNRETATDANSNTITSFYDEKDRQFKVRVVVGGENLDTVTLFDALDRKTRVTDPRGVFTIYRYDAGGRVNQLENALGEKTDFTHDSNGNVITQTVTATGKGSAFEYDVLNRQTKATDANSNSVRTEFNLAGQVWKTIDPLDRATMRTYNLAGNLATVTDPNPTPGALPVEFGYDDENNRTFMKDPRGKIITYQHDALNRRTLETQPTVPATTTHWRYDLAGNLDQITDGKGQAIGREFDELHRLKKINYPTGPPVTFGYDLAGNRTSMVDAVGTTTWTYDELNRPETLTDPFGLALGFGYDKSGNRSSVTYPGSRTATYNFDLANRLKKVTDWQSREINHAYDTTGRLDSISLPNGTSTKLGYDDASRLTGIAHRKGTDAPFADYTYTLGKTGTVDATDGTEPLAPTLAPGTTTYTYDDANQLATLNGNTVTHDANGNLTAARLSPQSAANDSLTFDYENRLTSASIAGQTTTSTYNGLGHRLAMARGGQTTRFLVDGTAPLAQIMAESDGGGNVTAFYLHAGGLAARILPDGTAAYYHADRRGSTVALTDGAGAVTDRYAYGDFGEAAGSTGSSTNPFRYLGRFGVHDTGDGTLFVRARHYHPDLGRFLSRDPLTGRDTQPQTLNRYIYALNNPLALVDVSGFASQEGGGFWSDQWDNFKRGAIYGDYAGNTGFAGAVGQTVVGLTPIGIAGDFRDSAAAIQAFDDGGWRRLGTYGNAIVVGIAWVPGMDWTKGAKNSLRAADEAAYALPELRISASQYPELADNIRNAQTAGHPQVLTHGGNANANRSAALEEVPNIPPLSRDEYPFASSIEGGTGAWVGHVPLNQQHAQGGLISDFLRRNNIQPGDQYRVVIDP